MPLALDSATAPAPDVAARIAVIDIGSNSIRLVIYDGLKRAPLPILNEKVQCALGRGLSRTGALNPEGVAMALANLRRFGQLGTGLGASRIDVLATAAVREASDGPAFIAEVERTTGLSIRIVSGVDEARLAAQGVMSGTPDADGLVGDMGGGSVELVAVGGGAIDQQVTLPLGPFRLAEVGGPRQTGTVDHVDTLLRELPWLDRMEGRDFFPVGGNWRAIARLHMEETGHPLHIIHHHTIETAAAIDFAAELARAPRAAIDRLDSISRRRETIQHAALVFERLLLRARPARVVFSAYGLREGHLFGLLDERERARDPLLAACADFSTRMGRSEGCEAMIPWTDGLIPGEDERDRRLREAACLLSEIAWAEHPDYRAEHAFLRVLRFPFPGIDHPERAFLALVLHARYASTVDAPATATARGMLPAHRVEKALALGLALRLAHTLSGGAPHLLAHSGLNCGDSELALSLPETLGALSGDVVERRLKALAQSLGRTHRLIVGDEQTEQPSERRE